MEKATQDYIADGLMGYKKLAKIRLRKRWKILSLEEKVKAARSLVFMETVAKNPEKYFSVEQTQADWIGRAEEYAITKKIDEIWQAFYFVEDPKEVVFKRGNYAMTYPLDLEYYRFLKNIQDYEYSKNWAKAWPAIKISKDSKRVCCIISKEESKLTTKKRLIDKWNLFKRDFGLAR